MVHIIMPVYNTPGALLQSSIVSIINQSYRDWKLWIIDDGTTNEETKAMLKAYEGEPQIDIRFKWNEGVASARNFALEIIGKENNDFIAYCDSDDRWDPDHLEDSLEYLEAVHRDLVYCNPNIVDHDGKKLWPTFKLFSEWNVKNLRKNTNFIYISSVVHKNLGELFDPDFNSIEDWEMWVRLASKGVRFVQKPKSTMTYLVGRGTGGAKGSLVAPKLKAKYPEFLSDLKLPLVKLNLGCGDEIITGYINVDLYNNKADMKFDCAKLPVADNSVDEIRAYHVLEHFDFNQTWNVLREWNRALKPGGKLRLETPDFLESCKLFAMTNNEAIRIRLYGHFFAFPWEDGNTHKFLFTEQQLRWQLKETGFQVITRKHPDSTYARGVSMGGALPLNESHLNLFLNVEAFK